MWSRASKNKTSLLFLSTKHSWLKYYSRLFFFSFIFESWWVDRSNRRVYSMRKISKIWTSFLFKTEFQLHLITSVCLVLDIRYQLTFYSAKRLAFVKTTKSKPNETKINLSCSLKFVWKKISFSPNSIGRWNIFKSTIDRYLGGI